MKTLFIRCEYFTAENPRGKHNLVRDHFMVKVKTDHEGAVSHWFVDDRTCCFYTKLTKYDENEILFEGSEFAGQTGSLHINRLTKTFTQTSDTNGEWLILRGDSSLVESEQCLA